MKIPTIFRPISMQEATTWGSVPFPICLQQWENHYVKVVGVVRVVPGRANALVKCACWLTDDISDPRDDALYFLLKTVVNHTVSFIVTCTCYTFYLTNFRGYSNIPPIYAAPSAYGRHLELLSAHSWIVEERRHNSLIAASQSAVKRFCEDTSKDRVL